MKPKFHIKITKEAIGNNFSSNNLNIILSANINQDGLVGLLAHDEYHFDNNKFNESYAYIETQRDFCVQAIKSGNYKKALRALGRMFHTLQDFYAHSNFIHLWIKKIQGEEPNFSRLNSMDPEILNHPDLISHQTAFPGDYLALFPGVARFLKPYLPENSHTNMNLDSPESGENFIWAYHASVERTKLEFIKILNELNSTQCKMDHFFGHI